MKFLYSEDHIISYIMLKNYRINANYILGILFKHDYNFIMIYKYYNSLYM